MRRHNTAVDYHIELSANAQERHVGMRLNRKQSSLENGIPKIENALSDLSTKLAEVIATL
jgi:hypothetical protein